MKLFKFMAQAQSSNPDLIADLSAGVSVASAGYAWLGTANELIQFIAGMVAIVAGIAAAWWHIERIRDVRRARKESQGR